MTRRRVPPVAPPSVVLAWLPYIARLQITLVGKVVALDEQQLQLTLKIDDGSGVVDVKYWIEDNNDVVRIGHSP